MPPSLPVQRPERLGRLCRRRHDHRMEEGASEAFLQGHRSGRMRPHPIAAVAQAEAGVSRLLTPRDGVTPQCRQGRGALDDAVPRVMPAPRSLCGHAALGGSAALLLPPPLGPLIGRFFQGEFSGVPFPCGAINRARAAQEAGTPAGGRASRTAAATACSTPAPPRLRHDAPRAPRPPCPIARAMRPGLPRAPPWRWRPPGPQRSPPRRTAGPRVAAPPAAAWGLAPWPCRCCWLARPSAPLRSPGGWARLSIRP
jgi:hypothetical protein